MIKHKYFYMSAISLLICNVSCGPFGLFDLAQGITEVDQGDCFDGGTTYQTEYQQIGIYRDDKEREFKVLVDYESLYDANTYSQHTTAKDIAELASMAIKALENSKSPKYSSIDKAYHNGLRSMHIIVTSTQEEFDYLYDNVDGARPNLAAYTFEKKFCWDHEEDINFNIVIKNSYIKNIKIISHEMTHNIGYHIFGDADSNHDNPALWHDIDGLDSIQGKILAQYELDTGINVIPGGSVSP